jgi:hypothetical protein
VIQPGTVLTGFGATVLPPTNQMSAVGPIKAATAVTTSSGFKRAKVDHWSGVDGAERLLSKQWP